MRFDTEYNPSDELVADIMSGKAERSFSVTGKAFYAEAVLKDARHFEEIMVGLNALNSEGGDDGTYGEFGFRWSELGKGSACKFHSFDDGWKVFSVFSDMFEGMHRLATTKDNRMLIGSNGLRDTPSPEMVVEMLLSLGMRDRTKTQP